MDRTWRYINGGSLEITSTVPLVICDLKHEKATKHVLNSETQFLKNINLEFSLIIISPYTLIYRFFLSTKGTESRWQCPIYNGTLESFVSLNCLFSSAGFLRERLAHFQLITNYHNQTLLTMIFFQIFDQSKI